MSHNVSDIDGYTEVAEAMTGQQGIPDACSIGIVDWLRYLFRDYIRLYRKVQSLEEALKIMKE